MLSLSLSSCFIVCLSSLSFRSTSTHLKFSYHGLYWKAKFNFPTQSNRWTSAVWFYASIYDKSELILLLKSSKELFLRIRINSVISREKINFQTCIVCLISAKLNNSRGKILLLRSIPIEFRVANSYFFCWHFMFVILHIHIAYTHN